MASFQGKRADGLGGSMSDLLHPPSPFPRHEGTHATIHYATGQQLRHPQAATTRWRLHAGEQRLFPPPPPPPSSSSLSFSPVVSTPSPYPLKAGRFTSVPGMNQQPGCPSHPCRRHASTTLDSCGKGTYHPPITGMSRSRSAARGSGTAIKRSRYWYFCLLRVCRICARYLHMVWVHSRRPGFPRPPSSNAPGPHGATHISQRNTNRQPSIGEEAFPCSFYNFSVHW
ncbi:hypothetical protein L209DRAFT_286577 [Thermothelomyces heterothallicus CBS 203.75]